MLTLKKTATSIFIVPLLGIRRERLQDELIGFQNGFLGDKDRDIAYENAVLLLFRPQNLTVFDSFLKEERTRGFLLEDYDHEGGHVVMVYEIPDFFLLHMNLFREGLYSQFPESLQERYAKVLKIKDPNTGLHRDEMALQWRIFRKDRNLAKYWEELLGSFPPDMEVWSKPDTEPDKEGNPGREILDIDKILKTTA